MRALAPSDAVRANDSDTIFALASGEGRAAVAVIRISGPAASSVASAMGAKLPRPREAALRSLFAPDQSELLDRALILWFPAPASFTGEDCLELHLHGGPAVVQAVIRVLGDLLGLRFAAPGEFTLRAFRNGKFELGEVEALADLIDADTQRQRVQALRQLAGGLKAQSNEWASTLLLCRGLVEAELDFSDQDDVGVDCLRKVLTNLVPVEVSLRKAILVFSASERMKTGLVVVIAGPPNVGKSSLLNHLVRREAAIVSNIPGTTRDPIEIAMELDGCPIRLIDTAGLREAGDEIEAEGVRRSLQRAAQADLVLWLFEADKEVGELPDFKCDVRTVATKIDMFGRNECADIDVSVKTGANIESLLKIIRAYAGQKLDGAESGLISTERQLREVKNCHDAVSRIVSLGSDFDLELIAEDLRCALASLERLTGKVSSEDVLSEIFARFCIGK